MPENTQPKPRRVSFGFILIMILVFGLIVWLAVSLFSNNNAADTLRIDQIVETLENGRLKSYNVTEYGSGRHVVLSGQYKRINSESVYYYTCSVDSASFNYSGEYTYTKDLGGEDSVVGQISELVIKYNEHEGKIDPKSVVSMTVTNPYETTWWDDWGPTIILLIGSILICVFLFSRLANSVGASNRTAMDFNKSRARRETKSKVRFSDVAGCDEEKAEMQEIVSYLKEPQKFAKFGAKLPKGILLVGNPGTGKTLLAKAIAGEAGVPFFYISGSDFVEMFVGVGAGRVRDMFKTAKENAPCLVFIDEIDAVGRQRGAGLGGGNDEREQTLNQLLVEMDGFADNSGIIVIAATNRDDVLDPALLRAGRFDRKITVSLPDKDGRAAIFRVHSRNKKLSPDVDFDALAKRTVGFSGADIENIMNEAAILAVRRNKDCVGVDEIDEAIDRRIAGPAKSSHAMNAHEREVVAYHEAGHAIIGLKLEHSDKVQKITIIPRGNTGGHVRMTPEEDRFLLTKKELEARIVGYLGGRSSEETFFDDVSSGAQNDIEMATRIARMMVTELGMSSLGPIQYERDTGSVFLGRDYTSSQKNFSLATAEQIDVEVRKIIDDAHDLAKKIISKHKKEVELIAKTLLQHEQITAEEIDYLLANGHLKRDEKVVPSDPTLDNPIVSEVNKTNTAEDISKKVGDK